MNNREIFSQITNPYFNLLNEEQKLAVWHDMKENVDFMGEYWDQNHEKINDSWADSWHVHIPDNWLVEHINKIGWDGKYPYFNLSDEHVRKHYFNDVFKENNVSLDEEFMIKNIQSINVDNNKKAYTNVILDKIRAAGIEVVTDKDEFDRILNTEQSIQRMTGDIEKLKELQKSLDDKKLQEKEIELAEQAQLQSEKELQEKYFKKFVNTAKEYQDYIPVGKLEKFSWVYYNSESKQLISDSKMRTENSKGHVAMMNVCLFKDISGDLHLGVYEDDSNFIEDISSIYNLTKEKFSTPAGQTNARTDRGLTDLNIYLDTFKKFALENDIANTFPSKIISRYETEIKSLETKNTVRINSLEKSQDNYNSYENRISGKSSESNVFNYKGYTFLPVRYFKPGDEYKTVKENLTWTDAIIRIPHTGSDYSINDFFAAADKNGNADIFYCVEKGKFFTLSETGIHSLNDGKRNKELYDSELEEFRSNNAELLSRLNKYEFNEEKDTLLMSNIAEVLELGEVFEKENETLGNVRIRKGTGINANGILHIVKRRIDKKLLHDNEDFQKAIEETSAIMFCAVNNIDIKPAVKETNGRWAVYNNGIKTSINKDKNGYLIVTGFDYDETNQEAAETINAVIARYGYKPEFHEIYAQVGAAYASLRERLAQQELNVNEKFASSIQKMVAAANTYGFVHDGKIYLNPDFMNSNAAIHEYTHLWDAYIQKKNPELWNNGLEVFKNTKYWNEVINDPNYRDIKDDENLVLSEIHSRICGDIAEKVLNRIAELDGEQVKLDAIDWNTETWNYISHDILNAYANISTMEAAKKFFVTPFKDLINEKNIFQEINKMKKNEKSKLSVTTDEWNALSSLADEAKMDWFYEETYKSGKVSKSQLKDLACAYLPENLNNLTKEDFLLVTDVFKRNEIDITIPKSDSIPIKHLAEEKNIKDNGVEKSQKNTQNEITPDKIIKDFTEKLQKENNGYETIPVFNVLKAAKKVLLTFTNEEKEVINKWLLSTGSTSKNAMETKLKKISQKGKSNKKERSLPER